MSITSVLLVPQRWPCPTLADSSRPTWAFQRIMKRRMNTARTSGWPVTSKAVQKLEGKLIAENDFSSGTAMKRCRMNHHNASVIRELFSFTRPRLIGLQNSIGFGDRLGIANPAHLRALRGSTMKPILASNLSANLSARSASRRK